MQAMESAFDVCTEDLFNQSVKLEEMEKKAGNAEGEVSALRGRLILLQENNEKQEERLAKATLELAGACQRADASVRKRIELENGVSSNEETIDNLDKQLADSKITLSDSENKFDDISRKLATLEADAARGNERAEGAEKKIADIEEELRVVGANMQQLEIGEEKTIAREEASQNEILELLYKLKRSEYRGEQAEAQEQLAMVDELTAQQEQHKADKARFEKLKFLLRLRRHRMCYALSVLFPIVEVQIRQQPATRGRSKYAINNVLLPSTKEKIYAAMVNGEEEIIST